MRRRQLDRLGRPRGRGPDVAGRGGPGYRREPPGGAGTLASEAVARAAADGQTLLVSGIDAIVFAFLAANRKPFDPLTDFTPVARITRDHWVLAVSPALGVSSVSELITLARSRPGAVSYASIGTGSSVHLMGARFAHGVQIEALAVPYKESYMPDLVAGRVSYVVHVTAAVGPQIKSGKLKGLAVFSQERIAYLPSCRRSRKRPSAPRLQRRGGPLRPRRYAASDGGAIEPAAQPRARQRERAAAFRRPRLDPTPGSSEDAVKYVLENLARQQRMRELTFGTP